MWLTKRVAQGLGPSPRPQTGNISLADGGYVYATGAGEARDIPVFGPYGLYCQPPQGAQALLLPVGDGYACVGVRCDAAGLQAGEVSLSACGAHITLKKDGSVNINGLVITKDGALIPKK